MSPQDNNPISDMSKGFAPRPETFTGLWNVGRNAANADEPDATDDANNDPDDTDDPDNC